MDSFFRYPMFRCVGNLIPFAIYKKICELMEPKQIPIAYFSEREPEVPLWENANA